MYGFLMFLAMIFRYAAFILLPYFIYLKVKNQQPKILPNILKYKRRVSVVIFAGMLFFSELAGSTPEAREIAQRREAEERIRHQEDMVRFKADIEKSEENQKKEAERRAAEQKRKAEEEIVKKTASATEEIKKSGLHDVVETIDGDTLIINYNGVQEKVRLVGLDTPETKHPSKPVQCFGQEASAKLREIVGGKRVYVEFDSTQSQRDKYGRLLLFIFTEDGQNVARTMIGEGYGHEYTHNSNPHKYQAQFREAEKAAREAKKGLWADNTCGGNTEKQAVVPAPAPTPIPAPTPQPQHSPASAPQSACNIKGNIGRNGMIYHMPGQKYYNKTNPERIFCSEAEAQSAGFRRSRV